MSQVEQDNVLWNTCIKIRFHNWQWWTPKVAELVSSWAELMCLIACLWQDKIIFRVQNKNIFYLPFVNKKNSPCEQEQTWNTTYSSVTKASGIFMNFQKKVRSMKLTCNCILPRSVTASLHQSNTSLIFFLLSLPHLTLNPHFLKNTPERSKLHKTGNNARKFQAIK